MATGVPAVQETVSINAGHSAGHVGSAGCGAAGLLTVMEISPALKPSFVAVILAVPGATAVTLPVLSTVATLASEDAHATPS